MKITKAEYSKMVSDTSPKSKLGTNCLWAFIVGGAICALGEALYSFYSKMGFIMSDARLMASIT
ncbi:MAG: SpoVA/SpoVAEb family sporulation membrane protein, partial [Oscillospiraceae bacterium]